MKRCPRCPCDTVSVTKGVPHPSGESFGQEGVKALDQCKTRKAPDGFSLCPGLSEDVRPQHGK